LQQQIFASLKAMDFLDAVKQNSRGSKELGYDFWVTMVADTITEEALQPMESWFDGCLKCRSTGVK